MKLEDIRTTAFGGYLKEDVQSYILELSDENEKLLEKERQRAEELKQDNISLLQKLEELKKIKTHQDIGSKYAPMHNIDQMKSRVELECIQMRQEATENASWQIRTATARLEQTEQECKMKLAEAEAQAKKIHRSAECYLENFSQTLEEARRWLSNAYTGLDDILPEREIGLEILRPDSDL